MFGNIGPFLLLTDYNINLTSSVISSTSKFSVKKATIYFAEFYAKLTPVGTRVIWGDGGQANFYRC